MHELLGMLGVPQPGAQLMPHLLLLPWAGTCLCSYLKTKPPQKPQQPNKKTQPTKPPTKQTTTPAATPQRGQLNNTPKRKPTKHPQNKRSHQCPLPQTKQCSTPAPSQQTSVFCELHSRYHRGRKERNESRFQKILRLETGIMGGNFFFMGGGSAWGLCV